jgi:sRNA-binding protein
MHEGIDKLAELYPRCFFRTNELRRPLNIGIRDDIFARQTDIRPELVVKALRAYIRSVSYWETLKAGALRIDLENPAGEVTIENEQHALVQIARAARRAKGKAIEDRKKAQAPVAKPAAESVQHVHTLPTPAPSGPPRLGLSGLKAAAQARRQLVAAE